MEIGKRIAKLRQEAGLSQEKLAEMLGISRQAVTKWESGKGNPDTENLIRLSEIFGCSLDELCGKIPQEKPEGKIHPFSHILALFSVLTVAAYCIIGGITGKFDGETLIMLLILAFPMHLFLHLIFWGMVKSGEFSMLAGFDSEIKYDTENLKRYVAGMDFMLGFETASYLFMMTSVSLIVPEFEIQYFLLLGYIISFVAGIFFMGYKFGDKIYLYPEDAARAKRGFPSSVILMVMIFLSVGAFILFFELKGYQNNTAGPFPMLGMMFASVGFSLGGYLSEEKRLKKSDEHAPLFGKPFIVLNLLALLSMVLMALL